MKLEESELLPDERRLLTKRANAIVNPTDYGLERLPFDKHMGKVGMKDREAICPPSSRPPTPRTASLARCASRRRARRSSSSCGGSRSSWPRSRLSVPRWARTSARS
jgi:hypothetical protein